MKNIENRIKDCQTLTLEELQTYQLNDLKQIEGRDISRLKNAMVEEGFLFPVYVWAGHHYVIDGAGRIKALQELAQEGYRINAVPVVQISARDISHAKHCVLMASSQHGQVTQGSFDNFADGLDLDSLVGTVFLPELDAAWKKLHDDEKKQEPECEPDFIPDGAKELTVFGDLFCFGSGHRLLCGDSLDFSAIAELMDGQQAHLFFTDPPIGFDLEDFQEILTNAYSACAPGASLYVCHAPLDVGISGAIAASKEWDLRQCITAIKQKKQRMGADYQTQHENIAYGWAHGGSHKWNGDSSETTVWEIDEEVKNNAVKPVSMIQRAIRNSSDIGDIVVDLFVGSGSTFVAGEMEGRSVFGIEKDPKYCDIIIARIKTAFPEMGILRNGEPL